MIPRSKLYTVLSAIGQWVRRYARRYQAALFMLVGVIACDLDTICRILGHETVGRIIFFLITAPVVFLGASREVKTQ